MHPMLPIRSLDCRFPAKRYDSGCGVHGTRKGWDVHVGNRLLILAGIVLIDFRQQVPAYRVYAALPSALLIAIGWCTGEPPRRGGGRGPVP